MTARAAPANPGSRKIVGVLLLALTQIGAMSLWFSASAVVPSLRAANAISAAQASLFTSSVQAGFVLGTLVSALLMLADRLELRRLFLVSSLVAAAANVAILLFEPDSAAVLGLRFLTGFCMAGIYPVGMKMIASWAERDLGFLVAILVGALSLGSGAPHLFNALGGLDWRLTIATTSAAAALAALAILVVPLGPRQAAAPPFDPRLVLDIVRQRPMRLAFGGYLGHMWELYAMWTWLGVFIDASFRIDPGGTRAASLAGMATFLAIGVGGLFGCVAGGKLADRCGRTAITIAAMTVSGVCAVLVGFLFGGSPELLTCLCVIWGVAIIADSAQFSAAIAELSDPRLVGTMLTMQTCTGFLLTLLTIHLMPYAVAALGWTWAFSVLAIGPAFGVWAMRCLRQHPDAIRLAQGRR